MDKLELQRQEALKKVDEEYYDRLSPHFKDNERYSWAVKAINKVYNDLKETT